MRLTLVAIDFRFRCPCTYSSAKQLIRIATTHEYGNAPIKPLLYVLNVRLRTLSRIALTNTPHLRTPSIAWAKK